MVVSKELPLTMSVNNALTRLASKKQVENDNLYLLTVLCVIRAQPPVYYTKTTADIKTGATGLLWPVKLLTPGVACELFTPTWNECPHPFGWVFSRVRLGIFAGLGICPYNRDRGATQLIVWGQLSLGVVF